MTTKLKKLPPNLVVEEVKQSVVREFRQIPGVGKSIAEDLGIKPHVEVGLAR